jgi:Predicted O-methyltransferase
MITNLVRKIPFAVELYRRIKPHAVTPTPHRPSFRALLEPLGEPFVSQLDSMYEGAPQPGSDGALHDMDRSVLISPQQGIWIFDLCRKVKPEATLEIGMAYGFSTMFFLAALKANRSGRHTAVDPYQDHWHGIGKALIAKLQISDQCQASDELGVQAMVRFGLEKRSFDVIFIDGSHRFDDVLVDFTLAAQICAPGGYIVMDDMWMPSIKKAVSFIRTNRTDFTEIKTPIQNIAAFQLNGPDKREWDHFAEFN